MRNVITIDCIGDLGKNLKEMLEQLEVLLIDNDVYIRIFDFKINTENKECVFETLRFAINVNSAMISELRKETAKSRKKGDVGKKKTLSDTQELELVEYIQNGHTRAEASDKYKVSPSTVSRVLRKHQIVIKPGPRK